MCARIAEFIKDAEASERVEEAEFSSMNKAYSSLYVKKLAFEEVSAHGYAKEGVTANILWNEIAEGVEPDVSNNTIARIDQWVEKNEQYMRSDYMYNARLTWKKPYSEYRDLSLIASFIACYFKAMQTAQETAVRKEKEISSAEKLNVGDKVTFRVSSARVLSSYPVNYYVVSYFYRLVGEDGITYVWSTSQEIEEGDTIKAKVKEIGEFRGERQVVITRGSVVSENE